MCCRVAIPCILCTHQPVSRRVASANGAQRCVTAVGGRRSQLGHGDGSGLSICGNKDAGTEHVDQSISYVCRSVSGEGAVDVERSGTSLQHAAPLRAMTADGRTSLAVPDAQGRYAARAAQVLPTLFTGTVIHQRGEAPANALTSPLS